jgi:ATP-dependent Clp protease protease subunit
MSVSMYRGGGGGYGRPKTAPPDLPSLLLDSRICYLGMPIVPAVTELIIAELLWLDYDNPGKPIYFYINSPGTQNDKRESIGFETEAYAIADTIAYVKPKVFTVNCGMAFGQAAMLLSIGDKGYRAVQPNSVTKLYSPKVNQSSGTAIDMWIKAKELDANTDYYIDLLTKGTGKPREEIAHDIQRPMYFRAQEAIDYGLADKIIESRGVAMERRNYDEMLAQSKAARQQYARPGSQSAPAGGR